MLAAETLADPVLLALSWQPPGGRTALAALFKLDSRLAQLVAQSREPMLGQIRLAWWREQIDGTAAPAAGDPTLDLLREVWGKDMAGLAPVVEGWEALLGDTSLGASKIDRFASGRGSSIAAFAAHIGMSSEPAFVAGKRWALADFAARTSRPGERRDAWVLGRDLPMPLRMPKALRGISVLDTLAFRAIERAEPMLATRSDALAAWRVGTIGW